VNAEAAADSEGGSSGRVLRAVLILSTLSCSWLLFMAVHELGHVVAGWVTGADVRRVALGPLVISETILGENPHPMALVWVGPLVGSLLPLVGWAALELSKSSRAYLARFFAGFCLVANGAYIGADAFFENGDGMVMVACGTPRWVMVLFGVAAVAAGLATWHRLGPKFGLGEGRGRVGRSDALFVTALLAAVILAELCLFRGP
jgi:hypothetical protein